MTDNETQREGTRPIPAQENLILKISQGELFRFFDSGSLTRFTLGSKKTCEVCVKDLLVLPEQIMFDCRGGVWYAMDLTPYDSRSEVYFNGRRMKKPVRMDGTLEIKKSGEKRSAPAVRISAVRKIARRRTSSKRFQSVDLTARTVTTIGREGCDVTVDNPQVSKQQCRIIFDGENCFVEDLRSMNGTYVNNRRVKRARLSNYDRISFPSAAYTYLDRKLLFSKSDSGIEIDVVGITKEVQDRYSKGKVKLVSDVSFRIRAGDFVAIVGGSGAGKSTILDCINGIRPATEGRIFYDTNNYYDNINSYKGVIGYVPQRDIMHDDLAVEEGLLYTALIRMRTDFKRDEVKRRVQQAIDDVKLTGREKLRISSLSGGQKKRVSIAMELLSDPKVIFLDEPTSGLSPDLDLEMMELLKELAAKGRTIVVITHAMENLDKCDRIAFLGRGGRLCYYGTYDGIFRWFNRKSYSRIFAALGEEKNAVQFEKKYRASEYYRDLTRKFEELYGEEKREEDEEEEIPDPSPSGRNPSERAPSGPADPSERAPSGSADPFEGASSGRADPCEGVLSVPPSEPEAEPKAGSTGEWFPEPPPDLKEGPEVEGEGDDR